MVEGFLAKKIGESAFSPILKIRTDVFLNRRIALHSSLPGVTVGKIFSCHPTSPRPVSARFRRPPLFFEFFDSGF
jgi:hypothetical protein